MEVYGKFTENAKIALEIAQQEATSMGHSLIGSEHILIGILRQGGALAAAFEKAGINAQRVRDKVLELVGDGSGTGTKLLGFSQRTLQILEISYAACKQLGKDSIGTDHLMIGIIREGKGIAVKILTEMGVNLRDLEKSIMEVSRKVEKEERQARENEKSVLKKFGNDLTREAMAGKLDPVVGREKEIERVIQILCRRTKNNPCLIGEPGVGKTAVVEGLAQKICSADVPDILRGKRIISLDMTSLVAGAKFRGEFEDRMKQALEETKKAGDVILFIDEMHTIIGAGASEGSIDASNILKPALSRGEIQIIGATTYTEFRKRIEKDPALERRFQQVPVDEPSLTDAVTILQGLREKYEKHHNVKITDKALYAAVSLSNRYISDRFLPDKAVDLMDEASARIKLKTYKKPESVMIYEKELAEIAASKEEAIQKQDFEIAATLRDREQELKEKIQAEQEQLNEKYADKAVVTEEEIAAVVAGWTGIPVKKLNQSETDKLVHLEEVLHSRIIGQEEPIVAISRAIRRARVGLKDPKRPIGSFLFLGPTGVGKTELCKALAEALFGDENAIIRLDMSEFMEKHSVSKLIGSPPGYVGYDEGGQLTEKVRRKPYSIVLLDEIEKASPDVFNILLQILEDGRLSDSKGKTADFKNCVIIMTSNVGAHNIKKQRTMGFAAEDIDDKMNAYEKMKENIMEQLNRTFRPEFLNRLDEVIVFHSLDREEIVKIIDLMVEDLKKRAEKLKMDLQVTDAAKELIFKEGFDEKFGARPLRRTITRLIEDKFAEAMLTGEIGEGDTAVVDAREDRIILSRKEGVLI